MSPKSIELDLSQQLKTELNETIKKNKKIKIRPFLFLQNDTSQGETDDTIFAL